MNLHQRATDLEEEFSFLDDWEDRYAHIIDMGKAIAPLAEYERNEQTRVRGCASQVWMVIETGATEQLIIRAESDAMIVSGLIAILIRLLSGASGAEITDFDVKAFLERIGVSGTLSAQRSNGLASMLQRIKQIAAASAEAD